MKKTLLTLSAAFALAVGFGTPLALACDKEDHAGKAASGDKAKHASQAETVALEGTIVSFGCPMEAAKQQCTGAALVVGETKHLIKCYRTGWLMALRSGSTMDIVVADRGLSVA